MGCWDAVKTGHTEKIEIIPRCQVLQQVSEDLSCSDPHHHCQTWMLVCCHHNHLRLRIHFQSCHLGSAQRVKVIAGYKDVKRNMHLVSCTV